jgi:hypothetical protein
MMTSFLSELEQQGLLLRFFNINKKKTSMNVRLKKEGNHDSRMNVGSWFRTKRKTFARIVCCSIRKDAIIVQKTDDVYPPVYFKCTKK